MKFLNEKAIESGALVLGVFMAGEAIVGDKHHFAIVPDQEHIHQEIYSPSKSAKPLIATMSTSADTGVRFYQWLENLSK